MGKPRRSRRTCRELGSSCLTYTSLHSITVRQTSTFLSNVSKRIRKVDPVPMNPGVESVEIWAYVGGQKRLDRRYKDRKVWLPRNYFQIYHKTRNWEPDPRDRVTVGESARAPEIRVQRVRASKEIPSVVRAPRRKVFAK